MPRPTRRPKSTFHIFRARVPADVMEAARGRTLAFPFPAEACAREHVENRGWRHLFMTLCRTHSVQEEARYFMVGHTPRDAGQRYGYASPAFLYRELTKIAAFAVE